eukprot:1160814-Pelagomonas_calceolata.AAC.7
MIVRELAGSAILKMCTHGEQDELPPAACSSGLAMKNIPNIDVVPLSDGVTGNKSTFLSSNSDSKLPGLPLPGFQSNLGGSKHCDYMLPGLNRACWVLLIWGYRAWGLQKRLTSAFCCCCCCTWISESGGAVLLPESTLRRDSSSVYCAWHCSEYKREGKRDSQRITRTARLQLEGWDLLHTKHGTALRAWGSKAHTIRTTAYLKLKGRTPLGTKHGAAVRAKGDRVQDLGCFEFDNLDSINFQIVWLRTVLFRATV